MYDIDEKLNCYEFVYFVKVFDYVKVNKLSLGRLKKDRKEIKTKKNLSFYFTK